MTTDPADMGELVARVEKLAAEREHFAEHSEANRDDWYATMPPELSEAAIQEAADLRALLAHLSRQEGEIKGLREERDAEKADALRHHHEVMDYADTHISARVAAESALSSLKGAVGRVVEAGSALKFGVYPAHGTGFVSIVTEGDISKFTAALSELESQCSAVAESKRREDAPSSAPGSDGGEL